MGNKKWTRLLALCLAVVCTLTVVLGATELQYDRNGDGKTTVWDLQNVLEYDSANYEKAVREALDNKGDELNPNSDNVYEIWTELGLRNMAKNASKGCSFKLMANIDLGGKNWTPVKAFKGTFDGNNKIISNFNITKSSSTTDMGFFGVIDHNGTDEDGNKLQSTVKNLNLRNVNIVATSGAQYIGLLTGQNRGVIENCTTVGTVTDTRTTLDKVVYVGAITGRNNNSNPDGIIKGTNGMNVTVNITEESDFTDTTRKVNSKMATFFSELTTESTGSRSVGLAGDSHKGDIQNLETGAKGDLLWQDITNSTRLADTVLQNRREAVAAEMYKMCTVPWTPSSEYANGGDGTYKELRYYNYNTADTEWYDSKAYLESRYFANQFWMDSDGDGKSENYSGGYYRGFPYNHGSSGMDRFLAMMDEGTNGIYTTSSELPDTAYYFVSQEMIDAINAAYNELKGDAESYTVPAGQTTTFTQDITDSNGVTKSVTSTIPVPEGMSAPIQSTYSQLGFNMYIGADCSSQAAWAWRKMSAVIGTDKANLLSTEQMYPDADNITKYGLKLVSSMAVEDEGDYDGDHKANQPADKSKYLAEFFDANKTQWWDALAMTSKGDLLMNYSPAGGHTRVALSDAVVIRDFEGVIDTEKSYIVTAEQGGSGEDSDGVNHYFDVTVTPAWKSSCCVDRRTTFADLTTNTYNKTYGYNLVWIPVTCDALRDTDSAAGTVTTSVGAAGVVTSNFHIVSSTVNGETKFTGIAQSGHRNPVTTWDVAANHQGVSAGDTVTVRLSDGSDFTFNYGTPKSDTHSSVPTE